MVRMKILVNEDVELNLELNLEVNEKLKVEEVNEKVEAVNEKVEEVNVSDSIFFSI